MTTERRTKKQIHISIVRDAVAQGAGMFAVAVLLGLYVSVIIEYVVIPIGIVLLFWWNNRIGKRKWHAYYFHPDGSPKHSEELY